MHLLRNVAKLSALALFVTAAAAEEPLDTRQFNVVGTHSTTNLYIDFLTPFFNETLPEASGGKLTATLQAFDLVGLNGGAVYEMLQQGVYDIGATIIDYVAGDEPRVEGLDIPAISDLAVSRRIADAYRPKLDQVFDEVYDARLLAIGPFTAQVVFCNAEITGLKDLAGKRIRGSGRMTMDFIEAVGGTGVSIAFTEVPVALDRGVIDCGITGTLSGYLAGWSEVSTHFYPLPVGGWDHMGLAISNKVWDGLNPATQEFLRRELAAMETAIWNDAVRANQEGINCNVGGECSYGEPEGLKLVEVSDEDLELALGVMRDVVLPRWAQRCAGECIENWSSTVGEVLSISME
jgi:TRAP-type C4-dicarboxylate transport system substrate-binding protein